MSRLVVIKSICSLEEMVENLNTLGLLDRVVTLLPNEKLKIGYTGLVRGAAVVTKAVIRFICYEEYMRHVERLCLPKLSQTEYRK